MNRRIHIPRKNPVIFDSTRTYKQDPELFFKPVGFWYGFEDAWLDWCRGEQMDWVSDYRYEVVVGASNILSLDTPMAVRRFDKRYGESPYPVSSIRQINWTAVAEEYDGIEIPVYIRGDFRYEPELLWYYGWDCESGVVWNLKHVTIQEVSDEAEKACG